MADEKYVLKHELEETKGSIHRRINSVDNKHTESYNELKLMLHTFMESQKPLNKSMDNIEGQLKTLNNTMGKYSERIVDMEYTQQDYNRRLTGMERKQEAKSRDNTKIVVALISAIATLGAASFGLAQIFF